MNGRPNYGPEALGRIERLEEKSIAAFFNEIPLELLKVVTGHLPSLAGFRPGTSRAVQRQLQSLAHKLATHRPSKSFARSPEEMALYGLWRAWSQSQITESATVRELLDGLDEENDEASDKVEQMSTAIKALVASGTCAREMLERFVTFSPFEAVDGFLGLARGARTAAEIKRDSTLLDLPDRLHKDEARLQVLETKLDASDRHISRMRSDIDNIRHAVANLRAKVDESDVAIDDLHKVNDGAIEYRKTIEESLARLTHATDRLAGRIAVNEKQAETIATGQDALEREVAGARLSVKQVSEQLSNQTARVSQLAEDNRAHAAELKSQGERFVEFDKLVARVDQLESMILELGDVKSAIAAGAGSGGVTASGSALAPPTPDAGSLTFERLRLEAGLSVKPLRTTAEILGSLDAALAEAGLKKSMASAFAEEILAAASSEQVIFFRGGFAVDVARKCALSICGTDVFRVAIPLGMTDPSLLRLRLGHRSSVAAIGLSAVVVEGVNNSPLDLLRDVLLDQVTLRVGSLGRQAPTIVIACLADGAGAFPIEPSYLELGPIFDLEAMDWRRLRREKLPVLGSIAQPDWDALSATWDGKAIDYEEALQGAQRLSPKRNARVEANVVRAFSALKAIRRSQGLTVLQSITFGWLAPYWQSLAAKVVDIDAHIDGGKCDGSTADDRLKIFLAEYRNSLAGGPA